MSYNESMAIIDGPNGYSIGLINDTMYNLDSVDNTITYNNFYSEKPYEDYYFPTRHGIFLLKDGEIECAACVCSSGADSHSFQKFGSGRQ
jgi:hypothetical protein